MKKNIKLFETFSGIGAQSKALSILSKKFNLEVKNVGISEWYIDAIIAYAKVHHLQEFNKLKTDLQKKGFGKKEILEEYEGKSHFVFSADSKKPSKIKNIKEEKLLELYVANIVDKNFGSITELKGADLPEGIDLFTYSFPCQAISLQGKQGGLSKDSETTSSLVWQVLRILEEAKSANKLPKVLMMENVKALFSKKFIETWDEIKVILDGYGYNTYDTMINAVDKGSIQRRERVFAVSVLKELDSGFVFNGHKHKKNNKMIKDILETVVEPEFIANNLKKHIEQETFKKKPTEIESLTLQNYTSFQSENILYCIDGKCPTLTASGANSRIKIIDKNGDLRYLKPVESWQLMGFDKKDFEPNKGLANATLYRLAGNSISVEILEDIFEDVLTQILLK